jgi:hypothetical protein
MPRMSSPSTLSSQKVVTNNRPTNYYYDLFDFARVYTLLIGESKRCQTSTPLKVDNVVDVDDDDVVYYLTSRRDVRLRRHEIKSKKKPNSKINLKKK